MDTSRCRRIIAAAGIVALGALGVPSAGSAAAEGPLVLVDVPAGAYYEAAVAWMLHEELTTGVGGRAEFQPARAVTRAEAVTFLWRVAGEPGAGPSGFVDVPEDRWYSTAVDWARERGITTGVGGTNRFAPDAGVTRAELATFLWRAAGRPSVPPPVIPPFRFEVRSIDSALAQRMAASWRPGCPVPLGDLRYLTIRHWGFHGRPVDGEMVVHAQAVPAVRTIFERLYRDRFPVERMRLVDDYGADDDRSMAANNTSAFNCRRVSGGTAWSEHAYGRAIDVNPVQNPYVAGSLVLPSAGAAHLDRTHPELGKIREGDAFVRAVDAVGWGWGGRWRTVKDYQHISASGR
ncbi:MAG: M15 family metallopeptidase [Acidimicrobiia bacterium]